MRGLKRFYPPDREVLKGINLSFYPGAKIGVIGSNGSGKSSLLRIMAGEDDGFTGEARLTPGFTVGYLPQEPQLNPSKDVAGNVAEGVGEAKALVDRFNEVCAAFGDARCRHRRPAGRAGGPAGQDRCRRGLGARSHLRDRHGRPAAPSGRRRRRDALGRRTPAGRAVPAAPLQAGPAPPRRADQPPRRRVGRLARADAAGLPGHRRGGDPRPVLPRQRGRLDPRARPRRGHPVGGQLLVVARAEAGAPRGGGEGRPCPPGLARA